MTEPRLISLADISNRVVRIEPIVAQYICDHGVDETGGIISVVLEQGEGDDRDEWEFLIDVFAFHDLVMEMTKMMANTFLLAVEKGDSE